MSYDPDPFHRSPPKPDENPYATGSAYASGGGGETHRGVIVLLLGLFGILAVGFGALCCPIFSLGSLALSIPAWVLGHVDLRAMREGRMNDEGRGMTMAGYIMGIVGTAISVLVFLVAIAFIAFAIFTSAAAKM